MHIFLGLILAIITLILILLLKLKVITNEIINTIAQIITIVTGIGTIISFIFPAINTSESPTSATSPPNQTYSVPTDFIETSTPHPAPTVISVIPEDIALMIMFGEEIVGDIKHDGSFWAIRSLAEQYYGADYARVGVIFSWVYKQEQLDTLIVLTNSEPVIGAPNRYEPCRACSSLLEGATFTRQNGDWILNSPRTAIEGVGSEYGISTVAVELLNIGPNRFGVILTGFGTGDITILWEFIVADIGGRVELIFKIPVNATNKVGGCDDVLILCWEYSSDWIFIPGTNPDFYDIKVITNGTRPITWSETGRPINIEPFSEITVYNFDGNTYVSVNSQPSN